MHVHLYWPVFILWVTVSSLYFLHVSQIPPAFLVTNLPFVWKIKWTRMHWSEAIKQTITTKSNVNSLKKKVTWMKWTPTLKLAFLSYEVKTDFILLHLSGRFDALIRYQFWNVYEYVCIIWITVYLICVNEYKCPYHCLSFVSWGDKRSGRCRAGHGWCLPRDHVPPASCGCARRYCAAVCTWGRTGSRLAQSADKCAP